MYIFKSVFTKIHSIILKIVTMKRLLTILSLICFSVNILSNDYRLITLSGKDGLSQQDVECILQDKQGFIWIGTYDGLNRYDGNSFLLFRHKETNFG